MLVFYFLVLLPLGSFIGILMSYCSQFWIFYWVFVGLQAELAAL